MIKDSVRGAIIERANHLCEKCFSPGDFLGLSIHHIKHKGMGGTSTPDVDSEDNLILLCAKCHRKEHGEC